VWVVDEIATHAIDVDETSHHGGMPNREFEHRRGRPNDPDAIHRLRRRDRRAEHVVTSSSGVRTPTARAGRSPPEPQPRGPTRATNSPLTQLRGVVVERHGRSHLDGLERSV
jgi:hypothetical protein